jgi:hypothetical protein
MCENQHCEKRVKSFFSKFWNPAQVSWRWKKLKLKNHDKSYTLLKTLNSMSISKTRELPNTEPNQKAVMQVYL